MDFLDPKKNLRHSIMLVTGYLLIAVAVGLGTIILLYTAYGYGFGKNGTVIQNGFLYLASAPNPASIYLNNVKQGSTTNARLLLQEGIYKVDLTRSGYHTWSRTIELNGGTVETFNYPLLIPNKIITSTYKQYSSLPALATQSPDQKNLVVLQPGSSSAFDVYNLSAPTNPATVINLPVGVASPKVNTESWQVVSWASDNQHVIIQHNYDSNVEYILFDIANPDQSLNLTKTLSDFPFNSISLINEKFDKYYLYNSTNKTLTAASLSSPTTSSQTITNVDSYNSYGNSDIIYATNKDAPTGKEDIDIYNGTQTYKIKELASESTYLLDMNSYSGTIYVAAGEASDNKVYIFNDPVSQIQNNPNHVPVPAWVLFVRNPNYLSFSISTQFIVAEGGQQFGVYDIFNSHGYNYTTNYALDVPQIHATWMDGNRLTYVSGGKQLIFDYDNNYPQLLMPASDNYLPFFNPTFKDVYSMNVDGSIDKTLLTIPSDQ